ncbi:hypothetical protein BDR04DRAFT_669895 [Suillus decipiens]|nr:hypothetical protein BDR04DRAFT_669895 [Suillus decipiens]
MQKRQRSVMIYLYLVVRYFGIVLAMTCAIWGGLLYIPEAVSISNILREFQIDPNSAVTVYFCSYNGVFLCIFVWRKWFSSGVFTPYTTNPSSYFMFSWVYSYLSSHSI